MLGPSAGVSVGGVFTGALGRFPIQFSCGAYLRLNFYAWGSVRVVLNGFVLPLLFQRFALGSVALLFDATRLTHHKLAFASFVLLVCPYII